MLIDLHCHTKYSRDNHLEPEDLIERAAAVGLDGVCLTEHYSVVCSNPVTRIRVPAGFLVFRGVEVSTNCGHLLVFGVKDDSWNLWGRNLNLDLAEVIRSVHALGGICVPAHPFRGWESLGDRLFRHDGFDAVETHNGANSQLQNLEAIDAAHKLGLPSIGGSDCHYVDGVGRCCTEFYNPVNDMNDLVSEIKAGACRGVGYRISP